MIDSMKDGMGRLAETEQYVAWVLENRDPGVIEFADVRRRTMAPQPR
jgi:hypothetical protein